MIKEDVKRLIKLLEINNELKLLELEFQLNTMNRIQSEKYFDLKARNTRIKMLDGEK